MEKKFLINFGALNISSLINKIIGFVFIVALTHLTKTADFGIYSLIWAHIGILSAWQDLGTTSVGMLQTGSHDNKKLHSLLVLRLLLGFIVGVGTVILAVILGYPFIVIMSIAAFSTVIMCNAVSGFFLIVTSINQHLTLTSVFSIIFTILVGVVNILVLYVSKSIFYMLFTTAALYSVYAMVLIWVIHTFYLKLSLSFDMRDLRSLIKRSLVFSLIAFFATLPSRSDFILLERLGGKENLALYAAAMKFFEASMIIIPNYNVASLPILKRYFQKNMQKFYEKIRSDLLFLSVVSLCMVIGTLVIGGPLITTFFSYKYQAAIPILNIIIWALPLLLMTSVILNALYAMGREKMVVWFFVIQSILHITANIVLVPRYGYSVPAFLLVFGELLQIFIAGTYLFYSIKHVRNSY